MDAVSPDVNVAPGRQIALLLRVLLLDQPSFRWPMAGSDDPAAFLPSRQRLGEVAGRNPLQVTNGQEQQQQRTGRLLRSRPRERARLARSTAHEAAPDRRG